MEVAAIRPWLSPNLDRREGSAEDPRRRDPRASSRRRGSSRAADRRWQGRVDVVASYDVAVRSASTSYSIPSVVVLRQYERRDFKAPKFSKRLLMLRDNFRCQCVCRADMPQTGRDAAAAAAWIFRRDIPWRRVAAAATWIVRGGRVVDVRWGLASRGSNVAPRNIHAAPAAVP